MCGRWGMPGQDMPPGSPGWGTTDCLGKGACERTGVEEAGGMFDEGRMTSEVFHRSGHRTLWSVKKLKQSG